MNHSAIGPSAAKRILACPGSVALVAAAPPQATSKHAAEGTKAHEVAEAYVLGKPLPAWATEEMIAGAKMYAGAIEDAMFACDDIQVPLQLETRVCATSIREDAWGTCDAFFIGDNCIYVFDYKFGAGVEARAEENEQMMYYALGISDTHKNIRIDKVVLSIVQPRLGGVKEWGTDLIDVFKFRNVFKQALVSSTLNVTEEGCRWCAAKATCPAQQNLILDKFGVDVAKPIKAPSVEDITAKQFETYLENADLLRSWIKAVEESAFAALARGMVIDGYELTESMGNRKWENAERAASALGRLYPESLLYEKPKLKSPAQMEKHISAEEVAIFTIRETTGKKLTKTDRKAKDIFDVFTEIK